jgi:hypothetical protein
LENAGSAGLASDIEARSDFGAMNGFFASVAGQRWLTLRAVLLRRDESNIAGA